MKILANKRNLIRYTKFAADDVATLAKLLRGKHLMPYIGFLGFDNLGDEVLFEAHQKLFPEHQFMTYRREAMYLERIAAALRHPVCSHAVLGGGTLINRQNHWIDRVEHLLRHNTSMFCIGTGVANPSFWQGKNAIGGETFNRWIRALEQFEFVGVRGPYSNATLNKAGFTSAKVTGDTALALAEEKVPATKSKGIVGLNFGTGEDSVMWGDPNKYRTELMKVIGAILASGSKVMLLPIRREDMPSDRQIVQEINHPNFTIVNAAKSFAAYSAAVRQCDIFIGQKLHSTVIACMNRVPSIMIEYRPKCRDFMASLGLEDYVVKTSELEFKPFMELFNKLQKNYESVKSLTETRILEYKHLQFDQAKKLDPILKH